MNGKFLGLGILFVMLTVFCMIWAIVGFAGMNPALAWSMVVLSAGFMVGAILFFSKV